MDKSLHQALMDQTFHLPRYSEIPAVGLYLKQVVKMINEFTEPYFHFSVTETMLSNYVKKHLVSNPVKKQYSREQIARLIFIVLTKTVLTLDDIQLLLSIQEENYEVEAAYEYFCCEFELVLQWIYRKQPSAELPDCAVEEGKNLLHKVIVTIAHKCYLDDCFAQIRNDLPEERKEN